MTGGIPLLNNGGRFAGGTTVHLSAGMADEALDKAGFPQQALSAADAMHRVASGILREAADREDAVQQALQKAWEKRHTLREPAYFDTWLIRILINECNSILRVKKRVIPMDRLPETAQEGMRTSRCATP